MDYNPLSYNNIISRLNSEALQANSPMVISRLKNERKKKAPDFGGNMPFFSFDKSFNNVSLSDKNTN